MGTNICKSWENKGFGSADGREFAGDTRLTAWNFCESTGQCLAHCDATCSSMLIGDDSDADPKGQIHQEAPVSIDSDSWTERGSDNGAAVSCEIVSLIFNALGNVTVVRPSRLD